ncbi:uncharacterized protein [Typha angustifolia]|uniref:uncharacterized protein n=1 Tax=Typha angustifolia TaxID=59011 RepID=UPI003C2DC7A8
MDLEATMDGRGWTEERHASFLNRIEDAFVRRMLVDDTEFSSSAAAAAASGRFLRRPHPPPVDCHLPDSDAESTHDFQGRRTNKTLPDSGDLVVFPSRDRMRRRPLAQYDVSQDQVVPQIGSKWIDADYSNKKMKSRK